MNRLLVLLSLVEALIILWLVLLVARGGVERPASAAAPRGPRAERPAEPSAIAVTTPRESPLGARRPAARERHAVAAPQDTATTAILGQTAIGHVFDPSGNAIERPSVAFLRREAGELKAYRRSLALARGYFVADLSAGTWTVSCSEQGYHDLEQQVEIRQGVAQTRVDLRLKPAITAKVKFVDSAGETIANPLDADLNVSAVATLEPLGASLDPATAARLPYGVGVGTWRHQAVADLSSQYSGAIQLDEPPPVYVSAVAGGRVLATQRLEPGQDEVSLAVDEDAVEQLFATLRFRVVDLETREPLAGVSGTLDLLHRLQPTDALGVARLERVAPGRRVLSITARDYESLDRAFDISPGAEVDLGDVSLGRAQRLTGVVIDDQGHGVPASLTWLDHERLQDHVSIWPALAGYATCDTDGRFTLASLGPRRYVLYAEHEDAISWMLVDRRQSTQDPLQLQLAPTQPVTLDFVDGDKIQSFVVWDARGLPALHGHRSRARTTQTIRLPAGAYRLATHSATQRLAEHPLTVGAQPIRLRLR